MKTREERKRAGRAATNHELPEKQVKKQAIDGDMWRAHTCRE